MNERLSKNVAYMSSIKNLIWFSSFWTRTSWTHTVGHYGQYGHGHFGHYGHNTFCPIWTQTFWTVWTLCILCTLWTRIPWTLLTQVLCTLWTQKMLTVCLWTFWTWHRMNLAFLTVIFCNKHCRHQNVNYCINVLSMRVIIFTCVVL